MAANNRYGSPGAPSTQAPAVAITPIGKVGSATTSTPEHSSSDQQMTPPSGRRSRKPAEGADKLGDKASSATQMHPFMFHGVPVTPMDINDTPLIAWRLALSEDSQV